jgi:hypothetical protein
MTSLTKALQHMRFVSAPPGGFTDIRSEEERRQQIATLAYFKALNRGFAPGHDRDDWLEAEREVDAHRYQ